MNIDEIMRKMDMLQKRQKQGLSIVGQPLNIEQSIQAIEQKYPELFDISNTSGILRIVEYAKAFRTKYDYESLQKWGAAFEKHISTHYHQTVYQKLYFLYAAVATFYHLKDHDQAFQLCDQAAAIPVQEEDYEVDVLIFKELSGFHYALDSFEESEKLLKKAVVMLDEYGIKYTRAHAEIVLNLIPVYIENEQYEEADQLINEACDLILINNYVEKLGYLFYVKAKLLSYQRDIEACEEYLQYSRMFAKLLKIDEILPYIEAIEKVVKLNKVGIWIHQEKSLIHYDKNQLADIYKEYMAQPAIENKILTEEIAYYQRKLMKLQTRQNQLRTLEMAD